MRILSLAAAVLLTTALAACTDMELEEGTMTVVKTSASGPPAGTPAPPTPEQRRKASSVFPPWGVAPDPERESDGLDNLRPGQKVWLTRAQAGGPDRDYRFRFVGSEKGPTILYLVVGKGASEKEYFVDRCARFDTDEFFPEGLLTPVECDGRRIVLEEENGSFIVRGGRRTVRVPATGRG